MEQFTQPVEEQNDAQETAADLPLPILPGAAVWIHLLFPVLWSKD